MRINTCSWAGLTCFVVFSLASLAVAQSGPGGTYQVQVTEADSLVWDLNGVEDLTADYSMGIENDDVELWVAFQRSFQQTGTGKVIGAGQGNATLNLWNEDGHTATSFPGTYKVTGVISSSRGTCRIKMATAVTGVAELEGASRRLSASENMSASVNNTTLTVSGSSATKASASGVGSTSGKDLWSNNPTGYNPHWTLRLLNIATAGKKVTGGAEITLHSGAIHQFTVKGTYNAKTQSSRLLVSGEGLAKGANLIVTIGAANTITSIKGRIFGQSVDVVY